jgi:hypothetical protein
LIRICYQLSIRMLIDKPFSRVLVTIQLLSGSLFRTSSRYVQQYASDRGQDDRIPTRTRKLGKKILQKRKKLGKKQIFTSEETRDGKNCCDSAQTDKRATGTVGEGAAGKKAKATQHTGGKSVSEKSQST